MLDIIIARDEISRNDRENTLSISAAIFFPCGNRNRNGEAGREDPNIILNGEIPADKDAYSMQAAM
jgi:hypothetical protein